MRRLKGYSPTVLPDGSRGYTVAQVCELLKVSEGTVRKRFKDRIDGGSESPQLCPAAEVEAARADLLERLGAVEPTEAEVIVEDSGSDAQEAARLRTKLRLLLAAQQSARDQTRLHLGEQEAYQEAVLQDIDLGQSPA